MQRGQVQRTVKLAAALEDLWRPELLLCGPRAGQRAPSGAAAPLAARQPPVRAAPLHAGNGRRGQSRGLASLPGGAATPLVVLLYPWWCCLPDDAGSLGVLASVVVLPCPWRCWCCLDGAASLVVFSPPWWVLFSPPWWFCIPRGVLASVEVLPPWWSCLHRNVLASVVPGIILDLAALDCPNVDELELMFVLGLGPTHVWWLTIPSMARRVVVHCRVTHC